jgi:hypothetical protein
MNGVLPWAFAKSRSITNPIYKFTTSVCPSVTKVLGGGGRGGGPVKQWVFEREHSDISSHHIILFLQL